MHIKFLYKAYVCVSDPLAPQFTFSLTSESRRVLSGNTEVVTQQDGISSVYLHGHKIAEIGDDYMTIYDGGYQSNTTKSRLNALCDEFCIQGESIQCW